MNRNIEITAEEYLSNFYDLDIKNYLELDNDMKNIIKHFALNDEKYTIDIDERHVIYKKIKDLFSGKNFYNYDINYFSFFIKDEYFISKEERFPVNKNTQFAKRETVFTIRLYNIRKYLLIEEHLEELNRILIKVSKNEEDKEEPKRRRL